MSLSEPGLTTLLRQRFAAPEFAFLPQVRNQTGFSRRVVRTADALAMSLYPSRGLHLYGFEIKCSRSDWSRDRDNPDKADEIAKHCHFWFIVAPDDKVVPIAELPATWGLILATKDSTSVKTVKAGQLMKPEPLTHHFLAAVLRKASGTGMIPRSDIAKEIEVAVAKARASEIEHARQMQERTETKLRDLQSSVNAFSQRSGIRVENYLGPNIASHAEAADIMRGNPGRKRDDELGKAITALRGILHNAEFARERLLLNPLEPDWSI